MRLTVIIACLNHGDPLQDQLQAIAAQSCLPDEILLVDDGSTDNSLEVMRAFEARFPERVRILVNALNVGLNLSQKLALEQATGDLIYFGAADDLVLPGFFSEIKRPFEDERVDMAFGILYLMNSEGDFIEKMPLASGPETSRYLSLEEFYVEHFFPWAPYRSCSPTMVYRRTRLLEMGYPALLDVGAV